MEIQFSKRDFVQAVHSPPEARPAIATSRWSIHRNHAISSNRTSATTAATWKEAPTTTTKTPTPSFTESWEVGALGADLRKCHDHNRKFHRFTCSNLHIKQKESHRSSSSTTRPLTNFKHGNTNNASAHLRNQKRTKNRNQNKVQPTFICRPRKSVSSRDKAVLAGSFSANSM